MQTDWRIRRPVLAVLVGTSFLIGATLGSLQTSGFDGRTQAAALVTAIMIGVSAFCLKAFR